MRQIPDNIETIVSPPETEKSYEEKIAFWDTRLSEAKLRHRIRMVWLDHWLECVAHPCVVLCFIFVLGVTFIVLKICTAKDKNEAIVMTADFLWQILIFGAGAIFTHLVSVFFKHYQQNKL